MWRCCFILSCLLSVNKYGVKCGKDFGKIKDALMKLADERHINI